MLAVDNFIVYRPSFGLQYDLPVLGKAFYL